MPIGRPESSSPIKRMRPRRPVSRQGSKASSSLPRSIDRSEMPGRTAGGRHFGDTACDNGPLSGCGTRDPATHHDDEEGAHVAEAYCVKDKKKVEVQNAQKITKKKGKRATRAPCRVGGGKLSRGGGGCPRKPELSGRAPRRWRGSFHLGPDGPHRAGRRDPGR